MLQQLLHSKDINTKQCAMALKIPYSTLSDLMNGTTPLSKTSGEILYKLAKFFHVSMESLLESDASFMQTEETWSEYKSNTLHALKTMGDERFIKHVVEKQLVFQYWKADRQAEAMYLVALVDYLCRIHKIECYKGFDGIRQYKLEKLLYPLGAELAETIGVDMKETLLKYAIPEFLHYNIVEGDIRNVC